MDDTVRRNAPCWESFLDLSMYLLGESLQPFKVGHLPHQVMFIDILQLGRFKCTVAVCDGGNVKLRNRKQICENQPTDRRDLTNLINHLFHRHDLGAVGDIMRGGGRVFRNRILVVVCSPSR